MTSPVDMNSLPLPHEGPGAPEAARAAERIRARVGAGFRAPACGIVLGSGLGGLMQAVDDAVAVPFADIPGFPAATVAGHAGQLLLGTLEGVPVALLAGRLHLYEGHSPALAGFPVRVLHALGAPIYLASNAAGGINRTLQPGDLMLIADHINLMFRNPLHGPVQSGDTRFPDMAAPYDPALRALLRTTGQALGIALKEGVYMGLLGPTYETPAEVRMLEKFGADAVGMSTVPEVVVARALGMRTVAVSLITNPAAGLGPEPLDHREVLAVGHQAAVRFEQLVRGFVAALR
jgi:purine-nucleoside phosphorylase